jgi:membrane fusion protein (multidrug efflux system)
MSLTPSRRLIRLLLLFGLLLSSYGAQKIFLLPEQTFPEVQANHLSLPLKAPSPAPATSAIGHLNAFKGIQLKAETPGFVKEIRFTSGQHIKKGEILIILDNTKEESQLKDLETQIKLAELTYFRDESLAEENTLFAKQADESLAALQQLQIRFATLHQQLKEKVIIAPFEGIGDCRVKLGQQIFPGTILLTLKALNPLYVYFNMHKKPALLLREPLKKENKMGQKSLFTKNLPIRKFKTI